MQVIEKLEVIPEKCWTLTRRNAKEFVHLLILKKQLKFMLNFALFCWDYLHTYSLYVPATGQALYADIFKFRLSEQRDQ